MDDCNCNSSTCDCCVNKPTTIQTETTTLLTPAYFNDNSVSGLSNDELLATQNVVLDVAATLTLFNTNVLNNAAFDKTEYTFVTDRLAEGAITQIEYGEFLNEYNYTVDTATTTGTATETIQNNPKKHMEQFNNFLKVTIAGVAVSSLCRFLSDPFNKITSAISLFSDFLGGFKSLKELLASLENPLDALSGLAASLKAFANSLINSVKDIVNSIKDKVSNVADKVSKEIAKMVGLQGNNKLSLNRWFSKQFVNVQNALSDGNIANLVTDISTKIAEAVLGFATLTIEAIQFLLFLFCKMATAVENSLMSVLDVVVGAASKIAGVNSSLSLGSADALRSAVEGGRPVPDPGTLAAQCQAYVNASNASSVTSDPQGPITRIHVPSNFSNHPPPDGWSNLAFSGQVLNAVTADGQPFWTTYGNLRMVDDGGGIVNVKSEGINPAIGYYGIDIHVLEMMNEVGRIMGIRIICSSGFRHPYYNTYLRHVKNGFDSGVAKNSQHRSGKAMDIDNMPRNEPRKPEFIRLCKQVGFVGFGSYNGFTHCDVASAREWNG
jgi:hypothetical protein